MCQNAVYSVFLAIAEVQPAALLKKAIQHKTNLRDSRLCDSIVKHIEQKFVEDH